MADSGAVASPLRDACGPPVLAANADVDAEILAVLDELGGSWRVFALVWGAVGLAWAADAIELGVLGFLQPCVGADFGLDASQRATIASIVFLGEAAGAVFFGLLADRVGRRPVSLGVAATVFVCAAASAASPNYGAFLVLQCGVGAGIGGLAVPFDLCLEFIREDLRGRALVGLNLWWAAGAIYANVAAWLVLGGGDRWRILIVACAAPSSLAMCAVALLPESPRWLLERGRPADAARAVSTLAASCGGPAIAVRAAAALARAEALGPGADRAPAAGATLAALAGYRSVLAPAALLWLCGGFAYYGASFLVTRAFEEGGGGGGGGTCAFAFGNLVADNASLVAGALLGAVLVDRGRRRAQMAAYAGCGGAVLALGAPRLRVVGRSIAGFAALGLALAATSVTWVHTPECFDTRVRASAHAVCNCLARLGSFATAYVVNSGPSATASAAAVATAALLCALSAAALPETAGRRLA